MRYLRPDSGFTLIELVVVLGLISIMLFFAVPRFQVFSLTDDSNKAARRVIATIRYLKESAVRDRKTYTLHVSVQDNRLWVTHETMTEEELEDAKTGAESLPENINIAAVKFPRCRDEGLDTRAVHFYKQGYSDQAIIQMSDDHEHRFSFVIEPFLYSVALHDQYVEFED